MRWYASLRRSGEIAFVRRSGRRVGLPCVAVHAAGSRSRPSRIAVSVSKSVGNAVVRNLVKRRIKGVLDTVSAPELPVRLVFVAREPAAKVTYAVLAGDVRAALVRLTG